MWVMWPVVICIRYGAVYSCFVQEVFCIVNGKYPERSGGAVEAGIWGCRGKGRHGVHPKSETGN
jgi:hypothetical protein